MFAIVLPIACAPTPEEQGTAAVITLTSSTLAGGVIPKPYTCDGDGRSPALSWGAPPAGTQSFALVTTDLDSRVGHLRPHLFVHWVMYALPAAARELPEAIQGLQLPDGSLQGKNGNGGLGYAGPCPPVGGPHRYAFTLYALDAKPDLPGAATERELRKAMRGHVIGRGQLVASFQR
ncbi:MAG TPA: YbhB/YbcL family Raf kinase inhibitor-like protein [Steroidobacteraceae bacterium]